MYFKSNGMPSSERVAQRRKPLGALIIPKHLTQDRQTGKTLLRIVKLTGLLLVAAFLQVSAGTTAQRLSISVKNGSLEKLFSEIEKKTNYVFFYDATLLQRTKPVTVEMKDASVEEILQVSLKGQGLDFAIQDKTIFVKRETVKTVSAVPAADGEGPAGVSVVVQSEAGVPLAGATVVIRKLNKSGMTNTQGEYVMKGVPKGEYEVEVTNVGFEKHVDILKVADGEARLAVRMKQATNGLDEMVVKGYYTTSNRLNTGDVTTVKGEDIQKQPVSDPILALEGRVPGLYISQTSGMPGAYYSVLLQGRNSIANGIDPLYIVDGVPVTSSSLTSPFMGGGAVGTPPRSPSPYEGSGLSPFNTLNPADIESITVLKDADATAIYGSRGANGVILITTKKGKAGQKTKVDVNVFSGNSKVTRMYHLLNTRQYLAMRHEAFYNDSLANPAAGIKPGPSDYDINGVWDSTRYTDWQKIMIGGTAHFTNAQASISGGDVNTQFMISGGYSRQTTVFPGNYYDGKASVHANINHVSTNQRFHALFTAQYVNDINVLPRVDFTSYVTLAPDAPALYTSTGMINWANGTWSNPMALTLSKANATSNNLIGSLNLGYEILPGLQLSGNFGYTHVQMNQSMTTPATAFYGPPSPNFRGNSIGTSNVNTWIIEPQLNYTKKVAEGKLDVLIGTTIQENIQNNQSLYAYGFASDALISNIASASNIIAYGSSSIDYRYNALFGRINYSWKDKYLINVTARRDGSSRFGPGKQFGNFGAVGAAWIFSKETFIQNALPFLSFGKLRASYGTTGNDQITDYQYLSTYSSASSPYQGITGLYPTQITNPYFAWEVVKKIEGGIELGWLKDRIIASAVYFRNRTDNQLVGYSLPSQDGFTSIQANLPATVQNTGVELELHTINFRTKNFTWSTSINATIPRNKLVAYPGLAASPYKGIYEIGQPLSIQHLFHNTGVDPQSGTYIFTDVNHDGIIDGSDKTFIKNITQSYYGGVLNSFAYKGLQLDMLFQFVKQTGINYLSSLGVPGFFNKNEPTDVLSRWHNQGQLTNIQKFTKGSSNAAVTAQNNMSYSDLIVCDASFIRLKNIALSYSLPKQWQRKASLQAARIYFQCQNLFTITSYKGLDPETAGASLPPMRTITAGVQVAF